MLRFTARRLLASAVVLAAMSFVIYALIGLMPGDPIDLMIQADPNATSADAARLRKLYGLDVPIYERYANWAFAALRGDFGYSRGFSRPVLEVMAPHLWRTVLLMGLSFVLSVAIAIPMGVIAAARPNSATDFGVNFVSFAGKSVPPFFLALMLMFVFGVWLQWLPASGVSKVGDGGFLDRVRHLVLPVACLTLLNLAFVARLMRSEMIAAMRQDFVRTARAKGLSTFAVGARHILRNALVPVTTLAGMHIGGMLGGAVVAETVFSWPGLGRLAFESVMRRDYNVLLGVLLLSSFLVILANMLVDLLQAWLDPRVEIE
jgi:peptide/nickel transport system permease protein